jgi:hypothetical protein
VCCGKKGEVAAEAALNGGGAVVFESGDEGVEK